MKKILYILFAMGLIVSSCSKDIDTDLSNVGDVAASFTNATITRATDGVWDSNEQIGIFAYDEAGAIYNSYENIPYITINGGSSASFTPSGTIIYYPTGSSTLSFIAYSPYQESADDGLYEVNLSPQSTTKEVALIDLIVADDGAKYSNTNTEASLQLNHKLAKLTMTLKNGDGLDASDLVGAEVKLTNIATEGTYNFEDDKFTPSSSDQTITPRTITADSKFEAIIFPYALALFDVEFYLPATDKTYTWDLNGEAFTSGKDHDYTITIKENSISISSATLSGWGVNDSEDFTADKLIPFVSTTIERPNSDKVEDCAIDASKNILSMGGDNANFSIEANYDSSNNREVGVRTNYKTDIDNVYPAYSYSTWSIETVSGEPTDTYIRRVLIFHFYSKI